MCFILFTSYEFTKIQKIIKELQLCIYYSWELVFTIAVTYWAIWRTGTNFVSSAVPAHFENTTSTPVAVHQGSSLKQQYKLINH